MKADWRLIAAGAVLAVTAFLAGIFLSRQANPPPAQALPAPAPVAALLAHPFTGLDGKTTTLAQWRGKPLIVNFWATWCPPCLAEMPVFSRLQEQHPEVQFVGIAVDTEANVNEFARIRPVSYPLLLADGSAISAMASLGNPQGALPFTLAIDAHGNPRQVRLGALSEAETVRIIADLGQR